MRVRRTIDPDSVADEFGCPQRKVRRFKMDPEKTHKRSEGLRRVKKHPSADLIR